MKVEVSGRQCKQAVNRPTVCVHVYVRLTLHTHTRTDRHAHTDTDRHSVCLEELRHTKVDGCFAGVHYL